MNDIENSAGLPLPGLDGANPLAFLAALGALRVATQSQPQRRVALGWRKSQHWIPILYGDPDWRCEELVEVLHNRSLAMKSHPAFSLGDNLNVSPQTYRRYAACACHETASYTHPIHAEFAAAFACDAIADDGVVQDSALRTMSGAGHQHFLGFMRSLVELTTAQDIKNALFESWRYTDDKPSMRWDPVDDRRYSLRWKEPSGDPIRTVRGANRMATEGLPLLPVMPTARELKTTGLRSAARKGTSWTWPIWSCALNVDVIRSVLALQTLQSDAPDAAKLRSVGISAVYRSQRMTVGKFRNFSASVTVA